MEISIYYILILHKMVHVYKHTCLIWFKKLLSFKIYWLRHTRIEQTCSLSLILDFQLIRNWNILTGFRCKSRWPILRNMQISTISGSFYLSHTGHRPKADLLAYDNQRFRWPQRLWSMEKERVSMKRGS